MTQSLAHPLVTETAHVTRIRLEGERVGEEKVKGRTAAVVVSSVKGLAPG